MLLTGSMTAKEKREAYTKIASGEANLIIGTHALIQEKVEYSSLALVVTDEQHRFGVRQEETLAAKGKRASCVSYECYADSQDIGHYPIWGSEGLCH